MKVLYTPQNMFAEQANMVEIMSNSRTTFILLHRKTVMSLGMEFTVDII